jgi:phage baseplate assembly protein W
MSPRDGFSKKTALAVALRASHLCSLPGCQVRTVGPSDEAPDATANIGEAAHICAASPGGKRYDASMTPAERSRINNAIWLCANHARLIDRDSATYTIDYLRKIKHDHEAACKIGPDSVRKGRAAVHDLIAIGPDIVCTGVVLEVADSEWSVYLENFVDGDFNTLVAFIDRFIDLPDGDRYLLVNELGDGRSLIAAPVATRNGPAYLVRCPVARSAPRIKAQELGSQSAMDPVTLDMYIENGQIARVSGLASLPQNVQSLLSMQRGESVFARDYGVRFAEYLETYSDSPWLGHLLKLDVIRQAAIPYNNKVLNSTHTPLQCINRVVDIEVLAAQPVNERLPIRCAFEVNGVGSWQCEVSVFVPSTPPATFDEVYTRRFPLL